MRCVLAIFVILAAVFAQELIRVGSEFRVNSNTANVYHGAARIVALETPRFLVVWIDEQQDVDLSEGIYGQLFDASSDTTAPTPIGNEFVIPTNVNSTQARHSIVHVGNNKVLVVWESNHESGNFEFFAQHVDCGEMGTPTLIGSETFLPIQFTANTYPVSMSTGGADGFLTFLGNDRALYSYNELSALLCSITAFGVILDTSAADVSVVGSPFAISNSTGTCYGYPIIIDYTTADIGSVVPVGSGRFVSSTPRLTIDIGTLYGISFNGQLWDASGAMATKVGAEFNIVPPVNYEYQTDGSVTGLYGGSDFFIFSWQTNENDDNGNITACQSTVSARIYDASGAGTPTPLGSSFILNEGQVDGCQSSPVVAAFTESNHFVAIWRDGDNSLANTEGLYARVFSYSSAGATPLGSGPELLHASTISSIPVLPVAATFCDHVFVAFTDADGVGHADVRGAYYLANSTSDCSASTGQSSGAGELFTLF